MPLASRNCDVLVGRLVAVREGMGLTEHEVSKLMNRSLASVAVDDSSRISKDFVTGSSFELSPMGGADAGISIPASCA